MDYYTLAAFVSLVCIPSVVLYLWWYRRNDDYWKKRGIPYRPRGNLLTALYNLHSKPFHEVELKAYREYGRIHGGFEFRKPVLTVADPEILRDILVKDFYAFNFRRDMSMGDEIFKYMITVLKGDDWKRVRTIMTPAFTSKRMRQMSHIIKECSNTVLETFGKHFARNEPVDCKSIFGAFTMDVIASSAFATKIDSHNDPNNIFVKNVKESFLTLSLYRLIVVFLLPPWLTETFQLGRIKAVQFFKDVIYEVIKKRKESGEKYDDMLQLLLDAQEEIQSEDKSSEAMEDETDQFGSVISDKTALGKKYKYMSEDEIVAQCILFFVVGYETTASTLTFMAYSLALNPECQEKLISEIDQAFQNHKEMDYDVVRDMKYLDCVVSEVLRMYPILIRSERTACQDYKLKNPDLIIEKGTLVGFPIQAMHFDPEFFPNPEKFDPERFLSENATHPQYAYLPFGAGPRNCLGMRFALLEIKLCICNILKEYRFRKAKTTKVPMDFKSGPGLLSVNELPLLLEKRS